MVATVAGLAKCGAGGFSNRWWGTFAMARLSTVVTLIAFVELTLSGFFVLVLAVLAVGCVGSLGFE